MKGGKAIAQLGLEQSALAGQVAVVSGAGRGIGREAARALAYLGAAVIVAEIDETSGAETASLICSEGGQALCVPTDVADSTQVSRLAERTLGEFGRVDVLVNNATLCPVRTVEETDPALWDRVVAVNLRGTFLLCKAFLSAMLAQGSGTIINMVSTDAMPGISAYIATKQGIAGFSQSLAAEMGGRGVRVVAFGPGMVDTPAICGLAPDLAPLLGLSERQFLEISLHPAYEGLMPATDAGAATAYLAARLAGEYHGEVVDGYTVLERAGYLAPAAGQGVDVAQAGLAGVTHGDTLVEALDLARRLAEIARQTDAEFDRLPFFARTIARTAFRRQAGRSVKDWKHLTDDLAARLERCRAGDRAALEELESNVAWLAQMLMRFAGYCREAPAATARMSKDREFLRQVTETMAKREAVARRLAALLEGTAGGDG